MGEAKRRKATAARASFIPRSRFGFTDHAYMQLIYANAVNGKPLKQSVIRDKMASIFRSFLFDDVRHFPIAELAAEGSVYATSSPFPLEHDDSEDASLRIFVDCVGAVLGRADERSDFRRGTLTAIDLPPEMVDALRGEFEARRETPILDAAAKPIEELPTRIKKGVL